MYKTFQFSADEDKLSKIIFLIPSVILINTYQNWGYKFVISSIFCFLISICKQIQQNIFNIIKPYFVNLLHYRMGF